MPDKPPGEADLRALSERFAEAELSIRALVSQAPDGNRRDLTSQAVGILVSLRREDFRGPIATAYLAAREAGASARSRAAGSEAKVDDLARSLHKKLDRGLVTCASNVRKVIPKVTAENLEEMIGLAVTAYIDRVRAHWSLGAWAVMTTETIGRQASSRGTIDGVGRGGKVVVDVGQCDLCNEMFSGELVVGEDPLPPGHPGCGCVASPA